MVLFHDSGLIVSTLWILLLLEREMFYENIEVVILLFL